MENKDKNRGYIYNFAVANTMTMNLFKRLMRNEAGLLNSFFGQILLVFIGTTVSIIFTLGINKLIGNHEQRENRRLSAMMVMSNIESFSRTLDDHAEILAFNDSIATWLINKPIEDLELLPEDELNSLIDQATNFLFLSRDKSAENIFTNSIETWKNMGNVQFIDQVGTCFSAMNSVEEYWNNRVTDVNETILDIKDHPENYEGNTIPIKILHSGKIQRTLKGIHNLRAYLSYVAATMRYQNLLNMESIGITEQEVMAYTDSREQEMESQNEPPDVGEFYSDPISTDSLLTFRSFDRLIDSLKGL